MLCFSPFICQHKNYIPVYSHYFNHIDTGLDIIRQSQAVHLEFIQSFQVCHELCKRSGFISPATSSKVDKCAVDFRHLSSTTATILSKVSGWLDATITFFNHLSQSTTITSDEEQQFVRYGKQAKELAKSFRVLAAWGRDLGGKLHEMQQVTKEEIRSEQTKTEKAQLKAVLDAEEKRERLEDAMQDRESAETLDFIGPTFAAMSISPGFGALTPALMLQASMSSRSAEARKMEKQAANEYRTAIIELRKKASENDKTQHLLALLVCIH